MRRMRETVIPATRSLQQAFRARGIDVIHARIACLLEDGRDRSLSQKKPGWNALLLPKDSWESQWVPGLDPPAGRGQRFVPDRGVHQTGSGSDRLPVRGPGRSEQVDERLECLGALGGLPAPLAPRQCKARRAVSRAAPATAARSDNTTIGFIDARVKPTKGLRRAGSSNASKSTS
jgi:hypothetical protein